MTSKLIDKLTKFCFHSASPPTPLRMERGVITEINLSLGITKPNSIAFTTKFCLYFTPSLYLSLCHSVSKKNSVFLCPYVILSLKKHSIIICLYVILSLKKICLYSSLCYSVSKTSSVSICPYVILSLKKHSVIICLYVILSLKNTLSLLVPMLFCL